MKAVRIPADTAEIAPDAFDPDVILPVPAGSPRKQWAEGHGYLCPEE